MFWIINAILILIALAFVLPSLLKKHSTLKDGRREQNIFIANEQLKELETHLEQGEIDSVDYQSTRDELEQSLFSDVNELGDSPLQTNSNSSVLSTTFIALLIPVIAISVYLKVGNQAYTEEIDSKKAVVNALPKKADGTTDIDAMVLGLQKKMEADPNNAKGWFMLGRSYMVLKRYPDATKSYEKALKLKPESADIMLSLADSLAMLNNGEITGRPVELINKALEVQPNNLTGLWLGGMAARQQGKYLIAIDRWKRALSQVSDPAERKEVNSLISEAMTQLSPTQKAKLAETSIAAPKTTTVADIKVKEKAPENKTDSNGISVSVSLSEEMKSRASPTDLVFIYAKAMSGPPMPLAAAKVQVKDLPVEVFLNDEMAMMPNLKLSSFTEVIVGARVSKSGQPISQNGDLFTEKPSIKAGQKVDLNIDSVVIK